MKVSLVGFYLIYMIIFVYNSNKIFFLKNLISIL